MNSLAKGSRDKTNEHFSIAYARRKKKGERARHKLGWLLTMTPVRAIPCMPFESVKRPALGLEYEIIKVNRTIYGPLKRYFLLKTYYNY